MSPSANYPPRAAALTPMRVVMLLVVVLGGYLARKYDLFPKAPDRAVDGAPAAQAPLEAPRSPSASEVATEPAEQASPAVEERLSPPPAAPTAKPPDETKTIVRKVVVKDQNGKVAFRGDIDLGPTLARIASGERDAHRNDGTTFQNREGRLPKKSSGYYKEYVHPTPGISGPGPQRVVTGKQGEIFYTPDHYNTFQRVK